MTAAIAGLLLAGTAMASPPPPSHEPADSRLLARIVAESRVERVPARPRGIEYAQAWNEAIERFLQRFFEKYNVFGSISRGIEIGAYVLIGTAIVLALFLIGRRVLRPAAASRATPDRITLAAAAPNASARDAEAWRDAFDRFVAQGSLEEALEALWWWFALSLSGEVDASWTNRQLLAAADRMDLAPEARDLDRTMYGPHAPELRELPAIFERLKEAIA